MRVFLCVYLAKDIFIAVLVTRAAMELLSSYISPSERYHMMQLLSPSLGLLGPQTMVSYNSVQKYQIISNSQFGGVWTACPNLGSVKVEHYRNPSHRYAKETQKRRRPVHTQLVIHGLRKHRKRSTDRASHQCVG